MAGRFDLFLTIIVLILFKGGTSQIYVQPEQVHLSYGDAPTVMIVTWVTMNSTSTSQVEYGTADLDMSASGASVLFVAPANGRSIYTHKVTLRNLKPGTRYLYHCGSSIGWSELFFFKTMQAGSDWSPRFAVYGDLGNENPQSLARLQEETQRGHFDSFLHVGDFAYDMNEDNSKVGDEFMRQIESIAAYVPYMTCPGNHESHYHFSNYRYRFNMPNNNINIDNMFYSFNIGPAHIISFNSEAYYFYINQTSIIKQYKWLQDDLFEANRPENRDVRPWVIVMGHKPMYCSNSNDPAMCTNMLNSVRIGLPAFFLGLEDLFYKYGVDLLFYGHEHSYERMWPIYNLKICNGSYEYPYTNPRAPVHIITGSAGCKARHDPFYDVDMPWSAFRCEDYGYLRMQIHNATHLYMEQVSDDKGGEVIDKIWLIKEFHGPGLYTCS